MWEVAMMPTTAPSADPVGQAFAFAHRVLRLTADDLRSLSTLTPVGDDVAWWDAVGAIERRLRAAHLLREAAVAGRVATQAVFTVANRTGVDVDRDVVAVAHAAGDAARAVVAGGAAAADAQLLLAPWAALGLLPARTPCRTG
jgi:hypothetical protein